MLAEGRSHAYAAGGSAEQDAAVIGRTGACVDDSVRAAFRCPPSARPAVRRFRSSRRRRDLASPTRRAAARGAAAEGRGLSRGGRAARAAHRRSAGRRAARGDRRGAEHLSRRTDRAEEARGIRGRGSQRRAGRAGVFGRPAAPRRAAGAGRGADGACARRRATRTRASARGAVRVRHAGGPAGRRRAARRCCARAGPDLAAIIGSSDPAMRYAAVRVLGRVFAKRAQDEPIDRRSATR